MLREALGNSAGAANEAVVNHGIDINAIIGRNKKGQPFRGTFGLHPITYRGNHPAEEFGEREIGYNLFTDGSSGFVVNAESSSGIRVAVCIVSFSIDPLDPILGVDDSDRRNFPRILQLQGCTWMYDRRKRRSVIMEALSSFSLEDVGIDLTIEFAKAQNMPKVAILPASDNPNRSRNGFDMKRAERRYDHTAIRRGFQKIPYGLYVMEL